jgi:two-component system chemotaxis sensor kinase CheA
VSQQSGDYLTLSIADDGAGMDTARIIDAAIRNGSLDPDHLASFSESQRLDLALQAGVSTSTEVTQDAGRGIGLAIVAEKIASIGGSLSIENCPGTGCLFILSVPTRLATLQALVIGVAGSRYIFPLSGIESVCTLDSTSIQTIEGRETVVKEGGVLPVIRLGQLLGHRPGGAREMHERTALVLRAGKGMCALLVEEILSIQEILPKSLGDQLQRVRYVSGAAQLGDGSLVLILKPEDILRYGFEASGIAAPIASPGSSAAASKRLLVVEDSITSRLLLKHILEGAGYQVETAVDGLDGLAKMRQGRFDGVISDIEMPHMDGFGLTESVRADAGMRETPIVLVSTLQSPAEKTRGFHAGADAYVVKGAFDQDNLIATVRRLV